MTYLSIAGAHGCAGFPSNPVGDTLMGSWANSLHVRHKDPQAVIEAIKSLMAQGLAGAEYPDFEPAVAAESRPRSDRFSLGPKSRFDEDDFDPADLDDAADDFESEEFDGDYGGEYDPDDFDGDDDDDAFDDGGPQERRLSIFQPAAGWVGILDSDLGGLATLARELSRVLRTDTLLVAVDDSDSWGYQFHRDGQPVDEFDSSGDPSGNDAEASPELEDAIARGDEDAVAEIITREAMAYAPEGPITMHDGSEMIPPHIFVIQQRMAEGKATFWERWRYRLWWLRFLYRALRGKVGGGEFGFDIPRSVPLDEATLSRHVANIRDFFPSADEAALRKLLPKSRFPSENLLVEFLTIVGLPGLYGLLNYDYQRDHSKRELAGEGIVRVADLRFDDQGRVA
jgi:hypothetical protein